MEYIIIYKDGTQKIVDATYAIPLVKFLNVGFDGIYMTEDTDTIQKIIKNPEITKNWGQYNARAAMLAGMQKTAPALAEKYKKQWLQ